MSKVLLVEDDPSLLNLMESYLEDGGHTVIATTDAKKVMEQAVKHKPDIIITDIVMPGMSGFELCRSLKKDPLTGSIPVMMCSSKNQEIDRLWGMKQGADAYLTKPFSREKLLRTVNLVVNE
ncbi:MAG: response regulator [Symploca sp. SIO1B1]|nr:response regulator [Symploca sp. SIO2D2]NER45949.1 response regulator [Symploca sp. SIO1A3]NER94201.1 response regulator [Symploca sp. SIO1B1]